MIRILQIGMTDNWGGIETFLINYYRNIDKAKIQFDFINIYDNKLCFEDEITNMGGKIFKISSYYKHPLKYISELKKIINDNNYQIIHCNMNSAVMIYPLIAAKLSKAKITIAHSHNASSDKGIIKALLHNINKQFIPLFANRFFACSNKAGKWFYSKKVMNSEKYYVINNAIDVEKFKFNTKIRNKKRKELGLEKDTIVVGHVGRFNKQKNHKFLIEIFNRAYQENNKLRLILIGIGPLMEEIKEKINSLSLSNVVLFLEQRNDVNELMQVMDIFILPSLYEGLPLVGVEAQVSGLKCLFSSSITSEVKLLNTTDYIDLNNLNEWVNKIIELKSFDRNNLNIDNFDIKIQAENIIKLYSNMINNRKD